MAKVWVKSLLTLNCHCSSLNFYSGCTRELKCISHYLNSYQKFLLLLYYTKMISYLKSCHLSNLSEWSVSDVCGDITHRHY